LLLGRKPVKMIKEVVYKPITEAKGDKITPDIGTPTKTEPVFYTLQCVDGFTQYLTIDDDIILTGYSVSTISTDGTPSGGPLYLNNRLLMNLITPHGIVYYYPLPYWLIWKNTVFKLIVSNDPAQGRTVTVTFWGFYLRTAAKI